MPEYKNTVHNIGSIFAEHSRIFLESKFKDKIVHTNTIQNTEYIVTTYTIYKNFYIRLLLFYGYINQTGVNLSESIYTLPYFQEEELVVIYDDITLTTGSVLLTFAKGSGLHNGAQSVDNNLHRNYWRLRIGYKKPPQISANDFVLSNLHPTYIRILSKISITIIDQLLNQIKKYHNEQRSLQSLQEYINRTSKNKAIISLHKN